MFYPSIFFFIFPCILLLNSVGSDVLEKNNDRGTKTSENPQKPLDNKERREIAQKYLNKLAKAKENWIDPYDMIGYPEQQQAKMPPEPQDEEIKHGDQNDVIVESSYAPKEPIIELNDQAEFPQFRLPELEFDEKPIFSNIRGGIIGEKIFPLDDTPISFPAEPGQSFTRGRQISVLDSIYISRWLKKVILKIEKESIPSAIHFPIDNALLNQLKELSSAKSLEITKLDELICNMIDQSSIVKLEDFDWSGLKDYAKSIIWPVLIFFIVAVCAYAIYQGILYHPLFTTLCCIIVCSVFWHWMHLYKQREATKLAQLSTMTMPSQCRKNEFGLIQHIQEYLKSFFITDECGKYYEALTVDPFWEVSITVAFSEAVASMLFQPLSAASRCLNLAIKQLFDGLSIFMVIPLLIFLFMLLIMLCNYRIRFPFFMGALEPHVPPAGSRGQELKALNEFAMKEADSKCKCLSKDEGCSQKSLVQGDVHMGTFDALKKCIRSSSEEQDTQPEIKDMPNAQSNSSSKNSSDQSGSEDDISIIDSEGTDSESENSLMEQIMPECEQNCRCCYPVEYLSDAECKACGDNLAKQNANDSFHLSSEDPIHEGNTVN